MTLTSTTLMDMPRRPERPGADALVDADAISLVAAGAGALVA